jgi:hypothetical protein
MWEREVAERAARAARAAEAATGAVLEPERVDER